MCVHLPDHAASLSLSGFVGICLQASVALNFCFKHIFHVVHLADVLTANKDDSQANYYLTVTPRS